MAGTKRFSIRSVLVSATNCLCATEVFEARAI
jgi:hypothetical protein